MKNKKKLMLIGGCAVALVLAIVLIIVLLPKNEADPNLPDTSEASETDAGKEVTVEDPLDSSDPIDIKTSDNTDTTKPKESTVIEPKGGGITPVEETKPKQDTPSKEVGQDTAEIVKPVDETKPPKEDEPSGGGIVIGGNAPEPYDCGTPGHHCDGPETHAYVLNLELEGCPYCGKHDCPSFYATDEWGQTCYTPSKCPSYDIHKDPVYYCQKCGKPCGDGSNGTCAEYNIDIDCPICGEHVEAWTCHSCK